jgi:hypothetical protein
MPSFPTLESEVVTLAQSMAGGYTAHATDFPGVTVATLTTALNGYLAAKLAQDEAKGQAKIATEAKSEKLAILVQLMKDDLKVSEADVSDDPEKLSLIGWGPKAPPTPIVPPGAPSGLKPVYEGVAGEVMLEWNKPLDGGAVRNYIIERRDQDSGGVFGPWRMLDFAYDTSISFVDQPQGVRLEYRVSASNAAGQSPTSNIISVIL